MVFETINGDERISYPKFIAFMVVTYKRHLSAVSKSTFGCPPLSILLCLRELLVPEWVFSKRTSEGRVCFHCNRDSTNGRIVEKIFLNELVLSRRYDECLCQSLQTIVFNRSVGEHVHSFFVIIILESNTTRLKRTIHISKTNIGVVANHVKIESSSN